MLATNVEPTRDSWKTKPLGCSSRPAEASSASARADTCSWPCLPTFSHSASNRCLDLGNLAGLRW
jgi:hypothetical protein